MPKYELLLQADFSAAHRLMMHDGGYEPLHGHNWRVEVYWDSPKLDDLGMVADFAVLQRQLRDVVGELHDTYLNELPVFADGNPTTELVARHIHDRLAATTPAGVRLVKVRVWEAPGCAATYIAVDG